MDVISTWNQAGATNIKWTANPSLRGTLKKTASGKFNLHIVSVTNGKIDGPATVKVFDSKQAALDFARQFTA
jgi:hypothetical protein